MLAIDVREIIVVIALEFAVSASYSVDVLSEVVVGVLADVLAGAIIGVVLGIAVEVLVDVNANICAAVMTALVEFPMPTTSEEFSCWTAFDCWPLAVLNCDRVLQTRMPSYHV